MNPGSVIIDTTSLVTNIDFNQHPGGLNYQAMRNPKDVSICDYVEYLRNIIKDTFVGEFCRFWGVELRTNPLPMGWHKDGSYLRSICVVEGACAAIRLDDKVQLTPPYVRPVDFSPDGELVIPLNHTVIFTGSMRTQNTGIPPTIHRGAKGKRKLIVTTWEKA